MTSCVCVKLSSACRPSSRSQGASWGKSQSPRSPEEECWGLAERKRDAILSLKSCWFILAPVASSCSLAHQTWPGHCPQTHSLTSYIQTPENSPNLLPCAHPHSHGGSVSLECFVVSAESSPTCLYQPYPHPLANK